PVCQGAGNHAGLFQPLLCLQCAKGRSHRLLSRCRRYAVSVNCRKERRQRSFPFLLFSYRTASTSVLVYSVLGCIITSSGVPSSTIFPSYITNTRSQKFCTRARSWQINRQAIFCSFLSCVNSSTICLCTVT